MHGNTDYTRKIIQPETTLTQSKPAAPNLNDMNQKNTTPPLYHFPETFRFCVSTAAHQVEGNNFHSDWWEWEQLPGKIKEGGVSGIATDSYRHLDEDIANMKWLGIKVYRFSIEWAKIEPEEGMINLAMLEEYLDQINRLNQAGIESMVTLYHFTLPLWVAKKGGWEWEGIVPAFEKFTEIVTQKIGPRVKLWITLNEPMSIVSAAYMSNVFPPEKNNIHSIVRPMTLMVKAHARSYHKIHEVLDSPDFTPLVGLAHHLRVFDPYRNGNWIDRYLAKKSDQIFNWAIPEAVKTGRLKFSMPFIAHANEFIPEAIDTQDFFGINYYSRDLIAFKLFDSNKIQRITDTETKDGVQDLGWEIYPEGLGQLLYEINDRYPDLKIWITENGIADASDSKRIDFIKAHLDQIQQVLDDGLPIEGYCHWTLNDNFEWAEGWTARFGLFSLEPGTLKRIPRPSAKAFSEIIKGAIGLRQ